MTKDKIEIQLDARRLVTHRRIAEAEHQRVMLRGQNSSPILMSSKATALHAVEDWERTYLDAWQSYYTPAHVETIMRRAAATGIGFGRLLGLLLECSKIVAIEKCHPMQGGIVRIKHRTDRRPGL